MIETIRIGFTNIYLLPCKGGYLMVDTSYAGRFREFIRKLERRRIHISEVRYLFLTHHHDDHAGFAEDLRQTNPAIRLIVHAEAVDFLKTGMPEPGDFPLNKRVALVIFLFNHLMKVRQDWSFPPVHLREDDMLLRGDDPQLLPSLGIDGTILYTPGHTKDSLTILLADGSALVGDLAMDLLPLCGCAYRPIYISDLAEVYRSWEKILRHGAKTIYAGHAGKPFGADKLARTMKRCPVQKRRTPV
ncbi:MAG: MBL fold metallo-hydrolase [Deltaproteobacteria bacterium]|nr:MBL fold metallo-hydrolase [Deltaproteobacteria bacterium]